MKAIEDRLRVISDVLKSMLEKNFEEATKDKDTEGFSKNGESLSLEDRLRVISDVLKSMLKKNFKEATKETDTEGEISELGENLLAITIQQ